MKKILLWAQLLILPFLRAENVEEYPVMILGSGVGALTSAIYLARAGIPPVVITGPIVGGTILQSHNVQNWPGEISISGLDLCEKVRKQAELNGATLLPEIVDSVDFSKRPFTITTKMILGSREEFKVYKTQSVIIALGAKPNLLNVPGENGYWSRGVYTCAVCDGSLYKDKVLAVVGGGDGALIEAEYLSTLAAKVHILVRRDEFRAFEKERIKTVLSRPNVEVHFETSVKEIKGDGNKVTSLAVHDVSADWELPVDAVFIAIGARPNTEIFRDQLELDAQGYILLKKHQQTSVEGICALGDVADREFKQAVSAAGDAAKAAIQTQKYLATQTPIVKKEAHVASLKEELKGVVEITTKAELAKLMQQTPEPSAVLIDFYADYCGPCRLFAPIYETWAKEYGGKIKFLKVNTAVTRDFIEEYQITAIPTLVLLDGKGNIVRKMTGFKEISEIEKRLEQTKKKNDFSCLDLR